MKDESLRARIRNLSRITEVPAQLLMQNYFLERLLYRISKSIYKENIVLKGGLLITSIIGVERRSTMDMDTSIKNMSVNENTILEMINIIIKINGEDNIDFELLDIKEIRRIEEYYGFRVRINAKFGKIKQKLSIDISTGDILTPDKIKYFYKSLLNDSIIEIQTYNLETILSEKIETIISRGMLNTRMRDFYDVYMLWTLKKSNIDFITLVSAIKNTFLNRNSNDLLELKSEIIDQIITSSVLKELWNQYIIKNEYASEVDFNDTILCINEILSLVM